MDTNKSVAVIGLGAMGLAIASNLAKAGFEVQAWNRSARPRATAQSQGIQVIENLSEISADIFLITLPDLPDLESVLESGLSAALRPGNLLAVMSTVSPVGIVDFAQKMKKLNVEVIDAPMSGGELGAINGTLSIMVGGSEILFNRAMPVFSAIGRTILLMGPVGSGQLTKAVNQIVVAVNLSALGEAITLSRRSGLDTEKVIEIFTGGLANSAVLELRSSKIVSGIFEPGGKSKFLLKDLKFALDAADSTHTDLPITQLVTDLYAKLVDHGDGDLDHSAVIKEIERLNS